MGRNVVCCDGPQLQDSQYHCNDRPRRRWQLVRGSPRHLSFVLGLKWSTQRHLIVGLSNVSLPLLMWTSLTCVDQFQVYRLRSRGAYCICFAMPERLASERPCRQLTRAIRELKRQRQLSCGACSTRSLEAST